VENRWKDTCKTTRRTTQRNAGGEVCPHNHDKATQTN
jgi:hypothetical protein